MDDPLRAYLPDFELHLRAAGRSPRTVDIYSEAARELLAFLGQDVELTKISRRDVQRHLAHLATRPNRRKPGQTLSPAYVNQHYRSLQQMFRWLVEVEEALPASPMSGIKPPAVPEKLVPIVTDDEISKLLGACKGPSFLARRDLAMIRLFVDTGARRAEILNLRLSDVDVQDSVIYVVGKGRRPRVVPFGDRTALALRRYLRARKGHRLAGVTDRVWLGQQGAVGPQTVRRIFLTRCRQAGIRVIQPHAMRHTMAHTFLAAGGQGPDLQRICGWNSPAMLTRYGASAAQERAIAAHRRLALGDRV